MKDIGDVWKPFQQSKRHYINDALKANVKTEEKFQKNSTIGKAKNRYHKKKNG